MNLVFVNIDKVSSIFCRLFDLGDISLIYFISYKYTSYHIHTVYDVIYCILIIMSDLTDIKIIKRF